MGKGLKGPFRSLWRYRVGDYRIICRIKDKNITIVVIAIGHRRDVYET
jgi:mRNA interferase RelE/StbE